MVTDAKFNEQYVIDWVKKKLGDPVICVELEETQLTQIIDDVLELFQKYQPKIYIQPYEAARGHHMMALPHDDTIGLVDIEFIRSDYQSYESIEGALLYDPFYFLSAGGITGVDVQTYDLVRHWTEVIAREFGAEEGYLMLDDGRVFIQCPGQMRVTLYWAEPYEGICDVKRPYQQIFLNLALAKSRQVLANIRGKFGQGVPGAGGGITLDAAEQRQRGEAEEEKYTDELMRTSTHFLPSMG